MNHPKGSLPIFRIQCKTGDMAGAWLWTITAFKAGMPVQSPSWGGILQNLNQYTFHAQFVLDESSALKPVSRGRAEGFVRILTTMGIDAEIVTVRPPRRGS
jgi:hypothetical protein